MKVRTLIKKLQELGDEYKNAEVTIQHPIFPNRMPLSTNVKTDYCKNVETDKCEVIVILNQKLK